MVEAARIELASESTPQTGTTCLALSFGSRPTVAEEQATVEPAT